MAAIQQTQGVLEETWATYMSLNKGFETNNKKWDPQAELPDLTGKVVIVTGAYAPDGLGYQIALPLALKGARVYLTARTLEKARDGVSHMKAEVAAAKGGADADVHPLVTELLSLQSVKEAAEYVLKNETRLDILVNNAAMYTQHIEDLTEYGVKRGMVANHLGPFLFTTKLVPLLKTTEGSRIVNVTSISAYFPPTGIALKSLSDLNQELGANDATNTMNRYGLSKLTNVLFSNELNRRFEEEGVSTIALAPHPGAVSTGGAVGYTKGRILEMNALTPAEGALAVLFAAAHPRIEENREEYKRAFLVPYGDVFEQSENMRNEGLAKDLWKLSEELVGGYYEA